MQRKEPLKQILMMNRDAWDHPGTRDCVRATLDKVLKCRTAALGSEVYASDAESKVVHHTCKSKACSSCGHRATTQWQRGLWCSLPDITYAGIVLTMPDVLWPIFRDNRHLLDDLPALGAAEIQRWAKETWGVKLMIMVVLHTFGRHLNFNPHLHIMVSAGGLRSADGKWVADLHFDAKTLMERWRFAVVEYLRVALEMGLINATLDEAKLRSLLRAQSGRWWNINVRSGMSKEHFLRYAARYARRPPIAQYRFVENDIGEVQFRTKDHKLKREILTCYSPANFIEAFSHHISGHYKHAIRYFGLLSPRSKSKTWGALFATLGQERRLPPVRISWAYAIKKHFGVDPLMDRNGDRMRLISRRAPI
jgi:hypothetical protein